MATLEEDAMSGEGFAFFCWHRHRWPAADFDCNWYHNCLYCWWFAKR